MHYNRPSTYPKYLDYLEQCAKDINLFYLTSPDRRKLEHFIDSESRFANRTPRESEYALAQRLRDTGTLYLNGNSNGKWADTYQQMLWLYNICVVYEYAADARMHSLISLTLTDLETYKCQYHKTEC